MATIHKNQGNDHKIPLAVGTFPITRRVSSSSRIFVGTFPITRLLRSRCGGCSSFSWACRGPLRRVLLRPRGGSSSLEEEWCDPPAGLEPAAIIWRCCDLWRSCGLGAHLRLGACCEWSSSLESCCDPPRAWSGESSSLALRPRGEPLLVLLLGPCCS